MNQLQRIKNLLNNFHFFDPVFEKLEVGNSVLINKLKGSLKTYLSIFLLEKGYTPCLFFEDIISAKSFLSELSLLGLDVESVYFNNLLEDIHSFNLEEFLSHVQLKPHIVLTTYNSINLKTLSPSTFSKNRFIVTLQSNIKYDDLINLLNELKYERQKFVGAKGEYAIRGFIIDVFSNSEINPARFEFDGDNLVSIRLFDIGSQRSFEAVEKYSIYAPTIAKEEALIFDHMINPVLMLQEKDIIDKRLDIAENYKKVIECEFQPSKLIIIPNNSIPSINKNLEILEYHIKKFISEEYNVYIVADQESHATRINDLLLNYSEFFQEKIDDGKIKILTLPIRAGFVLPQEKIAIFCEHQIFDRPFYFFSKPKRKIKSPIAPLLKSIQKGDYVVHSDFGIGKFIGLEQIKFDNNIQEVVKIAYQENDFVYVNINYLSKVKKFSSKDGVEPKLSKLGSLEWKNTKNRIKEKLKDAVDELVRLYVERKSSKGYKFSPDTVWQKELEASFYYEDTPDQIKVTEEIKKDMESDFPMERLVCGDVGFGKTEVAVRAAFKCVIDSKQVAILVPTTILAEQHYNTFKDRLSKFPIEIAMLSRFVKKSEQKTILERLSKGAIDILIGTHRILSEDVKFKDLGLLIIDEEHRFGVLSKEKIRKIKKNVDTLYLTATPIPRTLNMALSGLKDISLIATPPPNRLPIITEVMRFNIQEIRQKILFEIGRGGQAFFIHDRVNSIERVTEFLQRSIPEARFGIAHGQMPSTKLERVIHEFLSKKYDVLVTTKIVESGLDMPNVNTILINRADRFGLAELYQLRGRVGRTNRQAYAYLLVPTLKSLTSTAIQRIQALEEFSELGSGFSLSLRDLEIRGAGNILGTEQSGFINSVGFDVYMKILEEAVNELKQEKYPDVLTTIKSEAEIQKDVIIDVYFNYILPNDYIDDQEVRLFYYQRLFNAKDVKEIDIIASEIRDQFGEFPLSVVHLIELAKIRLLASKAEFTRVEIQKTKALLTFPNSNHQVYYENYFNEVISYVMENYKSISSIKEFQNLLKLELELNKTSPLEQIDFIKKFLNEIHLLLKKLKHRNELINFQLN